MKPWILCALLAVGTSTLSLPLAAAPISVDVDATQAPRGILHTHLVMPVKPGPLTLLYPKWLPGEHAPDGPIGGVSGLTFSANGRPLEWQRDADDMYAFHLRVPSGTASLEVSFDVLSVKDPIDKNALRTATDHLAIILWNQVVLYPAGARSDDLQYTASLTVPAGWLMAGALAPADPVKAGAADAAPPHAQLRQVSLTTLIDSPMITGRFLKTFDLGGTPPVQVHFVADSSAALAIPDSVRSGLAKLVSEATALFGATHYGEYHFLWTLSDQIPYEGIEHHESSDNRSSERSLVDDELRRSADVTQLLPHEYTHSWNGKYRRPVGLATGNYDSPMRGDLLWVYEGMTEYWGLVLSARSGLASQQDALDAWAGVAARMSAHRGREWRPLEDTAVAAQIAYTAQSEWEARTRGTDFYRESALLWLEADTLIRTRSGGAKSLDDFCRLFFGPPSGMPQVRPYDFDAVVAALNAVLPYDWHGFWRERLDRIRAQAPLEGLAAAGWRLSYADQPSAAEKGDDELGKRTDARYSLGFEVLDEGAMVTYLIPDSPADRAGMMPGSKLVAVNGRRYTKEVLEDALNAGAGEPRTLSLLVEQGDDFRTLELTYTGKAHHPRLERVSGTPDLLSVILSPVSH